MGKERGRTKLTSLEFLCIYLRVSYFYLLLYCSYFTLYLELYSIFSLLCNCVYNLYLFMHSPTFISVYVSFVSYLSSCTFIHI